MNNSRVSSVESSSTQQSDKLKSISHALGILNRAAQDSSVDIKHMITSDYQALKDIFETAVPKLQRLKEIRSNAAQSINQMRDRAMSTGKAAAKKVNESVHENPWYYIGGAAAVACLVGFLAAKRINGGSSR